MSRRAFVLSGLLAALLLAGVVSSFASSSPDGLEKVAQDQGFAEREREHALADTPIAGYSVAGVSDERVSTGAAGALGVVVTFAVGLGLFTLLRGKRSG